MAAQPDTVAPRGTRLRGMALAAALAFLPEVILLVSSYAAYGYLTPDAAAIVAVLLPCASLALVVTAWQARVLWSRRVYQDAVVLVGLTGIAFLLAWDAGFQYWSGAATCYECGFGWFFMLVFPTLVLEFIAGTTWLFLLVDARRDRKAASTDSV